MKIKFLADKGLCKAGHVDDYPEKRAKAWIKQGIAEQYIDKTPPSEPKKLKTFTKSEDKRGK